MEGGFDPVVASLFFKRARASLRQRVWLQPPWLLPPLELKASLVFLIDSMRALRTIERNPFAWSDSGELSDLKKNQPRMRLSAFEADWRETDLPRFVEPPAKVSEE